MAKQPKFPEELYISEIETWRKSSKLHAENAITQYKKVTEGLEDIYLEKTRNDAILSSLSDGIVVFDQNKNIIIFNKTAEKLLDLYSKDTIGHDFEEIFEAHYPELLTFTRKQKIVHSKKRKRHIVHINDDFISCRLDKIQIRDQEYCLLLLENSTDIITTQHALEKEKKSLSKKVAEKTSDLQKEIHEKELAKKKAEEISLTDVLTTLPNRRSFLVELENILSKCQRDKKNSFSLLFIDLDGFKVINDTLGHYAGDVLLIEISKRLQNNIRANDFCARLGGDEFIVLLDNFNNETKVTSFVNKILNMIAEPINFNDEQKMLVTSSIGLYIHDDNEFDTSTILTMADEAMYEAKTKGKNRYALFDQALHQRINENNNLTSQLSNAFDNNEFLVYYQPICNLQGDIIGAESLARWQHNGAMISPAKFIPLLEQRGTIKAFTRFVIEQVCETLIKHEHFPNVSINLSMQEFYDESFINYIDDVFKFLPAIRQRISFEITESLFHKDPNVLMQGITQLRKRGFRVYIDDFGTGYSSFSYIRNFEADVVKIDRAFIIDIESNDKNNDLLKGMIALLQSMGLEIVLEGIENEQQLKRIHDFNYEVKIQGFYFYKPMPTDEFLSILIDKPALHKWETKKMSADVRVDHQLNPEDFEKSFFKGLLDDMHTFVGILNPEGEILFINNTPLQATGINLNDILGTAFSKAKWWDYSEEVSSNIQSDINQCAEGKSTSREIQLMTVSGNTIWIEFNMHPIFDSDGGIKYLIPEGRDIDEKKHQFDLMKNSLDDMKTFIGMLDVDGTVCFVNNTPLITANLKEEDVINKKFWDCAWFAGDKEVQKIIKQDCKKTAAGERVNHEIKGYFEDKIALVDFSMHPVYEGNKVIRLIAEGRLKERPH